MLTYYSCRHTQPFSFLDKSTGPILPFVVLALSWLSTSRGGKFGVIGVKLMSDFIRIIFTILFYFGAWFSQSKCVVMLAKIDSTKIANFMTPGQGFWCRGVAL